LRYLLRANAIEYFLFFTAPKKLGEERFQLASSARLRRSPPKSSANAQTSTTATNTPLRDFLLIVTATYTINTMIYISWFFLQSHLWFPPL